MDPEKRGVPERFPVGPRSRIFGKHACVTARAALAVGMYRRLWIRWIPWALCLATGLALQAQTNRSTSSMSDPSQSHPTLVLGGGCFWCVEALYKTLNGVTEVLSGYAGGHVKNPTYQQVTTGNTGHAEVTRISYDPDKVSLDDVLAFFWEAHDPTTLNRQGADVGPQYRSIILYQDEEQRDAAIRSRDEASARFKDPIVTEIVPLEAFFPAESYHQDYYANNKNAPYCRFVIAPKLKKLAERD